MDGHREVAAYGKNKTRGTVMDKMVEREIYLEVMARFLEPDHREARALVNRIQELTAEGCRRCREEREGTHVEKNSVPRVVGSGDGGNRN